MWVGEPTHLTHQPVMD